MTETLSWDYFNTFWQVVEVLCVRFVKNIKKSMGKKVMFNRSSDTAPPFYSLDVPTRTDKVYRYLSETLLYFLYLLK